jgi:hypothetical protein
VVIKRETAYKMAIEALRKQQRKLAFDYNLPTYFPATNDEKKNKKYQRYEEAISILEKEKEHKQLEIW